MATATAMVMIKEMVVAMETGTETETGIGMVEEMTGEVEPTLQTQQVPEAAVMATATVMTMETAMVTVTATAAAAGGVAVVQTPTAGGNGAKTTAAGAGGAKAGPKDTAVAQGIQKAGPTDSLSDIFTPEAGGTNTALPTFGAIGTGAAAGTISGNRVGVTVMTVVPGPLTTEVYTTIIPGSGTNTPYTSLITMTTHGPSMMVPASLQTTEPGNHSVPRGVIAGVVVAFLIIVAFLVGWYVLRRRQHPRLGHASVSSSTPLVVGDIEKSNSADTGAKGKGVMTPVSEKLEDPFADTAAMTEKIKETPAIVIAAPIATGTSRPRSISRKPVPEPLALRPTLNCIIIEDKNGG